MRELIELMLIVALLMVVTNPDQDRHQTTLHDPLVLAHANHGVMDKITAGIFGKTQVAPLIYHNYYFFSTTSREGTTLSLGAFSHVWKIK